ncbi:hypothetical protein [Nocardioides pakistanensis]
MAASETNHGGTPAEDETTKPGPANPQASSSLDAPTPPGGPLRSDAPSGPVAPGGPGTPAQPGEPQEPERPMREVEEPVGAHPPAEPRDEGDHARGPQAEPSDDSGHE